MTEHQKYIFETCEYCTDWTRPTDASGNADYIKHVIENHLAEAAGYKPGDPGYEQLRDAMTENLRSNE